MALLVRVLTRRSLDCPASAGCDEIAAQIHKNNNDSEMILDEFVLYLVLVCIDKKKRRSAGLNIQGIVKLVRQFLEEEILDKASFAGKLPTEIPPRARRKIIVCFLSQHAQRGCC